MDDNQGLAQVIDRSAARSRPACLVPGCSCKDPRIVSHRRAAFFAAIAREHGETANRSIEPDPAWRLPIAAA